MALKTNIEVPASPPDSAVTPQAGHSADPSTRPSFESEKASQLDVIGVENLDVEKVSTTTKDESPIATKVYSLNVKKLNIKFAAICFALFLEGWNLGATGPLIPAMQKHYDVNYTLVSMIFLAQYIGFISGAMLNVYSTYMNFRFGQLVVLGHVSQLISWIIQAPAPPFPLFVLSFFFGGFGFATQDSQLNGFVAALEDHKETRMGIIHACFGLGAFAVPLVSTKFAQSESHWSFHYLTSVGVASACIVTSSLAFRFKRQDDILEEIGQPPRELSTSRQNYYRQIIGQGAVHAMAFFILLYTGVEITLGGWVVTYIIKVRGGGPSSGYISSGYWGGLTLGRVGLLWVNKLVGERRAIFLYCALTIVLEIVIWKVPSLVGNAVTISFVGLFLGPIFPIVINHASRVIPHWLLTGSIGWITGFGQTGVAVVPLAAGALAEKAGIWTLHPLVIGMVSLMVFTWFLVPGGPQKAEEQRVSR